MNVFTNDEEWVIAKDVKDVEAVLKEGGHGSDPEQFYPCVQGVSFTFRHGDGRKETKTFAAWAAERGRGYFAASADVAA
jgi:hypothetical protein